jgi:hypothetical protein
LGYLVAEGAGEGEKELPPQREVAQAFTAASRNGNLEAVLAVLNPEVVLRVDPAAVKAAAAHQAKRAPRLVPRSARRRRRRSRLPRQRSGRAARAGRRHAWGRVGARWPRRAIWAFKVEQRRIVEVQFIADPKAIARLEVLLLD